ncbi:MAG: BofC C-terminal domain-containing protein [Clostridia bacterium]|nr:BofC C-terminal domain-containing protein [Clostridia bacterium]
MPRYIKYFLTVAVFVLGISIGTYLGIEKEIKPKNIEKEIIPVQDVVIRNVQGNSNESSSAEIIETIVEETKLSPYAKMIIEKKYNRCGHTTVDVQNIPLELVNMTEIDIMQKYPDWEIRSFSSNEVSLFREIEANCNDHFVLKEKDGFLAVYNNISEDIQSLKEITDIAVANLPSGDLETLQEGIPVYGKDALANLIEDFST